MVFNKQGQKTGAKSVTYKSNNGAAFMQASIKENNYAWFKHYTSAAAFELADAKYGSAGQVGGAAVRSQAPNSASGNVGSGSSGNDFFSAHKKPDGTKIKVNDIAFTPSLGATWDGQYFLQGALAKKAYKFTEDGVNKGVLTDIPGSGGLTWDGEYLWNIGSNFLYQLKTDGTETGNGFTIPNQAPQGVAWTGSYFYIQFFSDDSIRKFKTDGTQVDSGTISGSKPKGLGYDGKYLYSTEDNNNFIRQYKPDTLTSVNSFSVAENNRGAAWNGRYLWSTDASNNDAKVFTSSVTLDISYQISTFQLPTSTAATKTRNPTETITVNDNFSDNTGKLTGFIYKDNSKVANAYVFAVEKSTQTFKGAYVTEAGGKYSVPQGAGNYLFGGDEYLVGVDYFDSGETTFYGEEKSIVFDEDA